MVFMRLQLRVCLRDLTVPRSLRCFIFQRITYVLAITADGTDLTAEDGGARLTPISRRSTWDRCSGGCRRADL